SHAPHRRARHRGRAAHHPRRLGRQTALRLGEAGAGQLLGAEEARQHMAWVAAAGPIANLAMALAWALLLRSSISLSGRPNAWLEVTQLGGTTGLIDAVKDYGKGAAEFLIGVSAAGVLVNLVFMLLNRLPIPPLDGGRILTSLLPTRAAWRFAKLEPWGVPLLLVLLFLPVSGSNPLILVPSR